MKSQPGKYKLFTAEKLTAILLFFFAGLWFYFPGKYVLIANQDLSLFEISFSYLWSFLDRPGGLLEYAGSFLNQFFRFRLTGALIMALVTGIFFFAAQSLFGKISGKKGFLTGGAVAALLLVGMHNYYPHQLSHTLGILLGLTLAAKLPGDRSKRKWYLLLGVPAIYLLTGGFVWLYCALGLIVIISEKEKTDTLSLALCLVYPGILIAASSLIYLYPLQDLFINQLPLGASYGSSPWPLVFVLWIVLISILAGFSLPVRKISPYWKLGIEAMLCLGASVLIMNSSFNRKNAEFFTIEALALEEDWDGVLEYTREHPSANLFGSFYTNLALANKGVLCEDLFKYPQGFGRRALCFPWEEKEEILRRGSDFFWTIHYVNESHHWAFESLIIEGPTRRNLRRLIQCELVRGNFRVAQKYIDQLGNSLFQFKLANHYAEFLNKREAIQRDPELGPRLDSEMSLDFFAEGADLEKNLKRVLANHPSRSPAIDYLMALYLLEKRVDDIPPLLPYYLESHQGQLSTLLDESMLVYQITQRKEAPSEFVVSQATIKRFEEYTKVLRQYRNPEDAARMLYPAHGHTFWFHLNFNSLPNR